MTAVDLALELVRLDTVNPPGREEAAASLLGERLSAAGFDVAFHEHEPGRPSVVARLAGDGPALCMTGHLDTVPLGGAPWSVEAFGELRDGRLYGRGSSDMKGGVAAIVVAAERVAALGRGSLEVVLCAAEETGCEGALHLAHRARWASAGAVLVAEPTGGVPHVAHKGVLWARATAEGKSAHGSSPQLGRNAIYPLAAAVAACPSWTSGSSPIRSSASRPSTSAPSPAAPGSTSSPTAPRRASTSAPSPACGAPTCSSGCARWPAPTSRSSRSSTCRRCPPIPDDPFVRSAADVAGSSGAGLAYFTDAAALTPAYGSPPTVIWGPGEAAQAHQTDEWASAEKIDAAAEGFFELARRWCGL